MKAWGGWRGGRGGRGGGVEDGPGGNKAAPVLQEELIANFKMTVFCVLRLYICNTSIS